MHWSSRESGFVLFQDPMDVILRMLRKDLFCSVRMESVAVLKEPALSQSVPSVFLCLPVVNGTKEMWFNWLDYKHGRSQKATCSVSGVALRDKAKENKCLNLQLLWIQYGILTSVNFGLWLIRLTILTILFYICGRQLFPEKKPSQVQTLLNTIARPVASWSLGGAF